MSSRPPPVPPAGRSPKGSGDQTLPPAERDTHFADQVPSNLREQDRQGNIKQNTTHQGYQQDR